MALFEYYNLSLNYNRYTYIPYEDIQTILTMIGNPHLGELVLKGSGNVHTYFGRGYIIDPNFGPLE